MAHAQRAFSMVFVWAAIIAIAAVIILFARGYRPNFLNRTLGATGILVANASPNGSQIYIDNKFFGVTSTNLYLKPNHYTVRVTKEGYSPWEKRFALKGEVVSRTDAQLFSLNPSLSPITNRGVVNPMLSPSKDKVVYFVFPETNELPTEETGGVMYSSINSGGLNFFKQRNLIIANSKLPAGFVPEKLKFLFSPDERNLLIFFFNDADGLLAAWLTSTSTAASYFDVTANYTGLIEKWELQEQQLIEKQFEGLKEKISSVLLPSIVPLDFSEDKTKVLYFATGSATLPRVITPPLIGSVPTGEERAIVPGSFYVYDSKEDKNFDLHVLSLDRRNKMLQDKLLLLKPQIKDVAYLTAREKLFKEVYWYADTRHIVFEETETISVMEYDGQNKTPVYSGPFEQSFNAVTEDGRLIILTNINPRKNKLPDLYTVSIK